MMYIGIYFLLILLLLTIFSGIVVAVDALLSRCKKCPRPAENEKMPLILDYSKSLFPVFLAVLLLRAFIAQPFKVPSGSLEPTVIPGDFMLVTQYNYGLRMPVWNNTIIPIGTPERGQIALFRWPVNPNVTFVKRVVGLPGDRISYINKVLTINGRVCAQTFIKNGVDIEDGDAEPAKIYEENLLGVKHKILIHSDMPGQDFQNLIVPPHEYLMMGDNRDASDDSRDWGFVSINDFIGRARFVWFNWNSELPWSQKVNWHRIGTVL